jgi:formylglycine-generating enzyme required for sulfatase activity
VRVPGGPVTLRDARTDSTRIVHLRGFRLSPVTITAADYRNGRLASGTGVPACPISWLDAVAWCNRASRAAGLAAPYLIDGDRVRWTTDAERYRLPTGAEWEYACRGGVAAPTYGPLDQIARTDRDRFDGPASVGTKRPNAFGLQT